MKNFFKVTLLLAFVAFMPNFQSVANASNRLPVENDTPEIITNYFLVQCASGQICLSWDSTCEYDDVVTILEITPGGLVQVFRQAVPNNFFTYSGLTVGKFYRVNVQDCDWTESKVVQITY